MGQAFPVELRDSGGGLQKNQKKVENLGRKFLGFFLVDRRDGILLQVRNASYLQAIAIQSILAGRKLSISHSKGMNSGVDNLSHLDLLWGKMFCPTFKRLIVVAICTVLKIHVLSQIMVPNNRSPTQRR